MGQKINPIANRLGYIRSWDSNWFGGRNYGDTLVEDDHIRKYPHTRLSGALVSRVIIERALKVVTITICTAHSGIIVGEGGQNVENPKAELKKVTKAGNVQINTYEVRKPEVDAIIVVNDITHKLGGRMSYKRTVKMAIANAMRAGAEGIKIQLSGRLNNAEMARAGLYKEERTPLYTLRADIDYVQTGALTKVGMIDVKVWIMNGEIYECRDLTPDLSQPRRQAGRRGGDFCGDRRGGLRRGGRNRSNR